MDDNLSQEKVFDDEMRSEIESLFSGMKRIEFGMTQTELKDSKRIERVMLRRSLSGYLPFNLRFDLYNPLLVYNLKERDEFS
jgi:hypothetical protein